MSRVLSPTESMARAFVALRGANISDHDALSAAVRDAEAELEAGLAEQSTYSKAQAAHLLDVSTTTLEQWIASGLLPVARVVGYKRDRVPARPLLALAAAGQEARGSEAEFERLYGPDLGSGAGGGDGEYVSAAPGPDFGPED